MKKLELNNFLSTQILQVTGALPLAPVIFLLLMPRNLLFRVTYKIMTTPSADMLSPLYHMAP